MHRGKGAFVVECFLHPPSPTEARVRDDEVALTGLARLSPVCSASRVAAAGVEVEDDVVVGVMQIDCDTGQSRSGVRERAGDKEGNRP